MAAATRAPAATTPPSKRLTKDQQDELTRHLYEQSLDRMKTEKDTREQKLIAECHFKPNKKLTQDDEESLLRHLYTAQMENLEKAKEKRIAELEKVTAVQVKQISEAELMDSIDRMYYQEKQRRAQKQEKLAEKYQPPLKSRALDPETMKSVNERLHDSEKGKFQRRRQELWEKHIGPMQPTFPKLSAEQVTALAGRLCTTNRG